MGVVRKRILTAASVALGITALVAGTLGTPGHAIAATPPSFSLSTVGAFGGEPSITSDSNGVLYDTTPSGPQTYRSNDAGAHWTNIQSPDNNSGDDCLNTDQANSLYWCNQGSMTVGNAPLQADVWKSIATGPKPITACTADCAWLYGNNATTGGACSTTCNPFGVDRQWVASTIRPGHTTATGDVVIMYHDFYGPSHIWVNISHDGGSTFGTAQEVLSGGVTNNPNGTVTAEAYTFCNTVPAGVGIVPPNAPAAKHPGRVIVAWIAADLAQDANGCNISMAQSFHTLWVSYSDDALTSATPTWSPQMAFNTGPPPFVGHDASTPFAAFTLDNQGDPYIAVDSPSTSENFATCAAESTAGGSTLQNDKTCSYNMYVVWSQDGGATWDGGGGTAPDPPGSAAAAYQANPVAETGTDVFPTIAAGDPGKVDVSYLHTDTIVPTDSFGKFLPLGCAGPGSVTPVYPPPTYPARCDWNLVASQSLNLTLSTSAATWSSSTLTTAPMHFGDICNLGIACAPTSPDPRHLLDFNQETIDPTTGCAHIGYADDNTGATYGDAANPSPFGNHLVSANQTSGPAVIGSGTCGLSVSTPEAPLAALLITVSGAGLLVWQARRRRLRARAI